MPKQKLAFSNRSHTRIVDDNGEQIVEVRDLCARLSVDALIRLHSRDHALLESLRWKYVHFNLETTLNRVDERYAILPIVKSGYRTPDGCEVLPVLDPRRYRIGRCNMVLQHVPIESVPSNFFEHSLPTIQTVGELAAALINRYAPLFSPNDGGTSLARVCHNRNIVGVIWHSTLEPATTNSKTLFQLSLVHHYDASARAKMPTGRSPSITIKCPAPFCLNNVAASLRL